MRWSDTYNRKWIALAAGDKFQLDDHLVNMVMFVARSADKSLIGFTVIEPRDLDQAFCARLKARMSHPALAAASFELYVPEFAVATAQMLIEGHQLGDIKITKTSFLKIRLIQGILSVRSKLRMINVDDSTVLLKFLHHCLAECGWIDIVAQVSISTDAVATILKNDPDVVTMDIQMPQKNGVVVLKELLAKKDYPVLMVSSLNLDEGSLVFEALTSGAFDYLQKPALAERIQFREQLVEKVLLAIQGLNARESLKNFRSRKQSQAVAKAGRPFPDNLLWCLGASTGGTQALTTVLTSLPDEIPPVVIVQHIPPVFSKAFAESLNNLCPFTVKEASDKEILKPNHVYIAPGGQQMSLVRAPGGLAISLTDDAPVNRFKPSVDFLFNSIAKIPNLLIVAGVLTGMGKDGAQGLLALKGSGASTFAQDEASSAVYGMPRAAKELGAADTVCHLDSMAEILLAKSEGRRSKAS